MKDGGASIFAAFYSGGRKEKEKEEEEARGRGRKAHQFEPGTKKPSEHIRRAIIRG